jgi:hypothetical protein
LKTSTFSSLLTPELSNLIIQNPFLSLITPHPDTDIDFSLPGHIGIFFVVRSMKSQVNARYGAQSLSRPDNRNVGAWAA